MADPAIAANVPSSLSLYAMVAIGLVRAVQPEAKLPFGFPHVSKDDINSFIKTSLTGERLRDASPNMIDQRCVELERVVNNYICHGIVPQDDVIPIIPASIETFSRSGVNHEQLIPGPISRLRCKPDLTWSESNNYSLRHTRGPKWSNNSCAVDCVLIIMLCMGAGTLQYDQLDAIVDNYMFAGNPFHHIAKIPWEALGDEQVELMTEYRDICLKEYIAYENRASGATRLAVGRFLGLQSAMSFALRGIHQASWHEVEVRMCETCGHAVPTHPHVRQRHELILTSSLDSRIADDVEDEQGTVKGRMQAAFNYRSTAANSHICTDPGCGSYMHRVGVVIEGLPPRLWVAPVELDCYRSDILDFKDVDLEIFRLPAKGWCTSETVSYRLRAFVDCTASHFTVYWRADQSTYYCYDGMMSDGMRTGPMELDNILGRKRSLLKLTAGRDTNNLVANSPSDATIVGLLYERKDCFDL